jgi:Protein of unknown function (DUF3465)
MPIKRVLITTSIVFGLLWTNSGCAVQYTGHVSDDGEIARAFNTRTSNVQVEGEGTVERILADDLDGGRHQRFIVRLASGQTVLISHNIDLAPRVEGLQEGERVSFYGEYIWNSQGGIVHWTHHDPQGRHVAGWLKHQGRTYQ